MLGYGAEGCLKVVSSNPGFAIRRLENCFVNPAVNGTSFESRKDMAAKGEGVATLFIMGCPRYSGPLTRSVITTTRL